MPEIALELIAEELSLRLESGPEPMPEELVRRFDPIAATAYLRSVAGAGVPLAFVGYSFGCTLLPAAVAVGSELNEGFSFRPEPIATAAAGPPTPLVLFAPTIGRHDYAPTRHWPTPSW